MSNSRALVEHIKAINTKSRSWVAEDPSNRVAGELVTMPDHWADYDVYTPEEFDRYQSEQDYIAGYKDVYGVKYYGDLAEVSDSDLEDLITSIYARLEAELEDLREYNADMEEAQEDIDELFDVSAEWDDLQELFDASANIKNIFH